MRNLKHCLFVLINLQTFFIQFKIFYSVLQKRTENFCSQKKQKILFNKLLYLYFLYIHIYVYNIWDNINFCSPKTWLNLFCFGSNHFNIICSMVIINVLMIILLIYLCTFIYYMQYFYYFNNSITFYYYFKMLSKYKCSHVVT